MPLHRPDVRPLHRAQARDVRQADPCSEDDLVRAEATAVIEDELWPVCDGGHTALLEGGAGRAVRLDEGREEGAVVDLVVAGHLDAAA